MKASKIFSLFLLFAFVTSFQMNAQNWYGSGMKGEGPKVKESVDLASFDAVKLTINGHVYLEQGSTQSVKIEAQKNILDNIVTEVDDNTWKIKFHKNVKSHDGVKIWITMPELTMAAVSGSGDLETVNYFKGMEDVKVAVSGSGNIDLEGDSKSMQVSVSGSGDIELGGNTGDCQIRISGSGDVEAFDLEMENCKVKIAGSGDATVNVQNSLEVGIAGSGDVVYKGSPKVRSKISGSGDVTAN